jgi:hypothetical protein
MLYPRRVFVVMDQEKVWSTTEYSQALQILFAVSFTFNQTYAAPNTLEFIQR